MVKGEVRPCWSNQLFPTTSLFIKPGHQHPSSVETGCVWNSHIHTDNPQVWKDLEVSQNVAYKLSCDVFWLLDITHSQPSSELNWNRLFEANVCSCFSVFLYSHRNCGCCSVSRINYYNTLQGMPSHKTQVNRTYTCGVCEYCVTPPRVVTNVGVSYVSHPLSVGCGNAPVLK